VVSNRAASDRADNVIVARGRLFIHFEPALTQDELIVIAEHFEEIAEVFREAASRQEI